MKLYADFTQLQNYPCGIATYIISLYRELLALYPDMEVTTGQSSIRPSVHHRYTELVHERISEKVALQRLYFPGRINLYGHPAWLKVFSLPTGKYDVCHLPGNYAPSCFPIEKWHNSVLTIHDLFVLHPEFPHHANMQWLEEFRQYVQMQAKRAQHIITVSQFTKADIVRLLHVPEEKITVIPNAPQWTDSADEKGGESAAGPVTQGVRYFLAVSNVAPHKNYDTLLDAWERFSHDSGYHGEKLVIVGRLDRSETSWRITHSAGVVHLENLSQGELRTLYRGALGFFALSLFEGFGIPLLEAMGCGCPACYATGNSMAEIGRDAAIAVSPNDIPGILQAFCLFQAGGEVVEKKRQAAKKIAEEYSWKKTAEMTMRVFQKVCG